MPRLIFTPWKELSELLSVREHFYPPPTYDGPDMRAHGCALVEVWKLRGGLPHAVESTALLTDAILHDDASKNSVFSIRATYSAAFCRFVTVLVDSKIQGKKRTMFQRATDLGLPASFVELRHEATHRELPSLVVLRGAAQRSLEWLWDYYWSKNADSSVQGLESSVFDTLEDDSALKETVTNILRCFTGNEDSGSKKSSKPTKNDLKNSLYTAQKLFPVCGHGYQGVRAIAQVLVEDKFLIPENKMTENEVKLAFSTWDTILKELSRHQPGFLTALVDELANSLLTPREIDLTADPYGEAVYMWLDHILTSASWATLSSRYISVEYIIAFCKEDRGYWTGRLRLLVEKRSKGLDLQPLGDSGDLEPKPESASKMDTTDDDKSDIDALRRFGWDFQTS